MKIHNQQHKLSEVVNEGLTPIMQVPVVDKIFSSAIKERYDHYQPKSPNNIGKKVLVAHETVTDFVLDAIAEINEHNDEKQMPSRNAGLIRGVREKV